MNRKRDGENYGWLNASLAIAAFTKRSSQCRDEATIGMPFGRALVHPMPDEPGTLFDVMVFLDDVRALEDRKNLQSFLLDLATLLADYECEYGALYYDNNPDHEAYGDLVALHKPDIALWIPEQMMLENEPSCAVRDGISVLLPLPFDRLARNPPSVRASPLMHSIAERVANELETWAALQKWGRQGSLK